MKGILSLCAHASRRRLSSDEVGVFLLEEREAANVQAGLEERVVPGVSQQVLCSLQQTLADICEEHPEDASDLRRARSRTCSDLSAFVEVVEEASGEEGGSGGRGGAGGSACSAPCAGGLLDHERLTRDVYEAQGLDFAEVQGRARAFLRAMGLRPRDSGASNTDENGQRLWNQCFYLSIAHGYLGSTAQAGQAAGLALRLRRAVEACVLAEHPSWAGGLEASAAGEGPAMVFADFLPVAMRQEDSPQEPNFVAKLAICILDSVGGHVEVYLGPGYNKLPSRSMQEKCLVLLWYTPGHYQCIVKDDATGSKVHMTYEEFKGLLVKHGVVYIETLE